jgi:hypothetical protein
MPEPERSLETLQRRLARLITSPSGLAAALAEEGDPEAASLARLLRGDRGVSARVRLEVYANAWFERLRGCLAEDFGTLAARLGSDAFHDLVKLYLLAHPPRHFSLRYAGERLPEFLAVHQAAELFRTRWPEAADLAALEWALADVFDAPDAATLSSETLASLAPEAWAGLRLAPVAALRLLELAWPVQRLRRAFDADEPLPALVPEPTSICVWRKQERVFYRPLSPLEAACLRALARGESFGDLCERVAAEAGQGEAVPLLLGWLRRWLDDALFAARETRDTGP